MNTFVSSAHNESKWTKTANNADALNTTGSALLDLFAQIGALRTQDYQTVATMFAKAFSEDPLLATKMAFYARNVRGGLGERKVFRYLLGYLATYESDVLNKNMHLIPKFGRWDDLYTLVGTKCEDKMWKLIENQFQQDLRDMKAGKPVSLLAKWLKSVNTSSEQSRKLGKLTAKKFGLSEKTYRKAVSWLRKHINITERLMCDKEFRSIDYEKVPSLAMNRYRKTFYKRDEVRFTDFISKVKSGEKKIKAATLYPYDIVEKIIYQSEKSDVLEAQWNALPNYVEGENNMLVMADVSGSMTGRPMATSVGLALYFAERNKGAFSNLFMTFSAQPQFVFIKGKNLFEKIHFIRNAHWQQNTDFELAMEEILRLAVQNNVPQEDMPKSLIVISDMQFDQAKGYYSRAKETHLDIAKQKFEAAGYTMPKLIYWNCSNWVADTHQASQDDNVQFISGQSASAFKTLIRGRSLSAYELMLSALNDEQYAEVTV
ncbi:DUF2828 family protein [Candidatus Dojkabacteria bacterium]|nr:DUF2828 family protein [Candidatus Dojkabacteria bacterium]